MSDYKLTLQPFVIVILSVQKIEAAYVIINEEKYQFQDVTSAIAFCWKSFYVLNAAFPSHVKQFGYILKKKFMNAKK